MNYFGAANVFDRLSDIFCAVDRRARYQNVGARLSNVDRSICVDPAVDLDIAFRLELFNHVIQHVDFPKLRLDELLPAEARIDRHNQDQIGELDKLFDRRQRSPGVERHARFATEIMNLLNGAMSMIGSLDVKRDDVRSGVGEGFKLRLGVLDHQMNVEGRGRNFSERFDDGRTDRNVGDKTAVHHVDVNVIGAGIDDAFNVLGKVREVRRQN